MEPCILRLCPIFFFTCALSSTISKTLAWRQSALNLSLSTNPVPNNVSSSDLLLPGYEVYHIPDTDLTLHLTLLQNLDPIAMESCLSSAKVWVNFQKSEEEMPRSDFEWIDYAGAVFYIRSLSSHLTWGNIRDVLSGLLEDLYNDARYLTLSFTVEETSSRLFIGQGRLSKYHRPLPTMAHDRTDAA